MSTQIKIKHLSAVVLCIVLTKYSHSAASPATAGFLKCEAMFRDAASSPPINLGNFYTPTRTTESSEANEVILDWRSDRKFWSLDKYKERLGRTVVLERWGNIPVKFEYLALADLSEQDALLSQKLIAKSKSPQLLNIGKRTKPPGYEDSLKSVEVSALQIHLKSGEIFRTFITSADENHVDGERILKGFLMLMSKEGFHPENILEVKFFHTHPDWNVEVSEGDYLFSLHWREIMRAAKVSASLHMYAISQMQDELLLTHIGLNP